MCLCKNLRNIRVYALLRSYKYATNCDNNIDILPDAGKRQSHSFAYQSAYTVSGCGPTVYSGGNDNGKPWILICCR